MKDCASGFLHFLKSERVCGCVFLRDFYPEVKNAGCVVSKSLFETTSRRISGLINRFQKSECVREIFFFFGQLQLKFHTIILKCAPRRTGFFSSVSRVGVVHFFSYQREPELRTCSVNDFPGPAVRQ